MRSSPDEGKMQRSSTISDDIEGQKGTKYPKRGRAKEKEGGPKDCVQGKGNR